MSSDYKLAIAIGGKLDSSLAGAANQAKSILNQLNGGGTGSIVQKGMSAAGKAVSTFFKASAGSLAAITTGMVTAGKAAVDTGMDFESAMSDLAGTAGINKSSEAYAQYAEAARNVGATTNKTATEAAQALKYMSLAGWDTQESISALDDMVKLSSASGEDLAKTSDLVTDSMGALGLTMTDYGGYMDMVARADSAANYSSSQFMETMIGAGGAARLLNIDLNELGTAAGILANNGTKGSEAGTALNSMFTRLAKDSKPVHEALAQLGTTITDDSSNFLSFEQMLGNIKTALGNVKDKSERAQIMANLFGTNYQSEAQYLLDSIGEDGAWDKLSENLENAKQGVDDAGNAFDVLDERYKTATDTLQGDLDILKSATQDFGIEIYNNLVGGQGTGIRGAVQEITDSMNNLKEAFKVDGLTGLAQQIGTEVGNIATELQTTGPQAIEAATNFATELVKSIGSEDNSESIGNAAASIITSVGEGFLNYTAEFGTAAGNLLMGLGQGLVEQGTADKLAEGLKGVVTNMGSWFKDNGAEFGETAGNLVSSLVGALAENSGDLLVGGIEIVEGLAKGLISGAVVLASNAPQIVSDLLNGILDAIPRFFDAGVAVVSAIIDGIGSLGMQAGKALVDALTMTDTAPEMEEVFDPGVLDTYGEHVDAVNEKMIELANGTDLGPLTTELLEGQTTIEQVMADMESKAGDIEYFEDADDIAGYMNIMKSAMDELGISYEQAQEVVEESSNGISEATKQAMESAKDELESGTSTDGMTEQFEQLKQEAQSTGQEIQTALSPDMTTSLSPDALSGLLTSIDAGTIDGVVETLNTTMTTMQTTVSTAATAVQTSITTMSTTVNTTITTDFTAIQTTVETTMTASQTAAETAASGIVAAFASIDLAGIANNMMAGLVAGIQAGGAAAIAAAQSIASQIASVMSSALQIHSPSKVMEGIGNYVGLGLAGGMEQSAPTVYSAASSLAGTVGQGTTDSLSGSMNRLNAASAGAGGESSGSVTFAPQITITGNASEGDVRNALQWSMEQFRSMYERMKADDRRMAYA